MGMEKAWQTDAMEPDASFTSVTQQPVALSKSSGLSGPLRLHL